ncbi:MAG: tRNA (adenosine(37)-N6)-dimethylallyltransferase MiaA [Elusimicrobia bacterium]|nr:tRNA (adenosine(37)-N6)-dimethylallyltransferase MiaA [Elusimicrobiota bacterium]
MKNGIILIVGPTASGKTDIAIKLAKTINGEIISADSRQIYKHLNIGTSKPTKNQVQSIKYNLINIIKPNCSFNAGQFVKLANRKIKNILDRKKIPVIVGGTGLYAKALTDGLIEVPADKIVRKEISNFYRKTGLKALYKKLAKLDPVTAATIDKNNPIRVMRALEICLITGKKYSELRKETKKSDYKYIIFGLKLSREELYKRINERVDEMIKKGLIREVKNVIKKYSLKNDIINTTIGYKELLGYIKNICSKERAIEMIKQNTRHYAKRQMTWFNKDKRILWIDVKDNPVKKILNYINKSDIIQNCD